MFCGPLVLRAGRARSRSQGALPASEPAAETLSEAGPSAESNGAFAAPCHHEQGRRGDRRDGTAVFGNVFVITSAARDLLLLGVRTMWVPHPYRPTLAIGWDNTDPRCHPERSARLEIFHPHLLRMGRARSRRTPTLATLRPCHPEREPNRARSSRGTCIFLRASS
jgi:hypothetical protein